MSDDYAAHDDSGVSVTKFGFKEEVAEEVRKKYLHTNWPKPLSFAGEQPARWRLVYESTNQSVEELYFSALENIRLVSSFHKYEKITDLFAASEQSAFFGVVQQRLGIQQDKVSQFLGVIGKMIKELFQLVRELRIIDERLEYYHTSRKGDQASEITLKGYWIDLAEGGSKNPASVYGLSRELQFVTLPDIFFGAPPMPSARVQEYVEGLSFNRKVKEVLMRKLKSFIVWKEHTYKELNTRRIFTIKYLKQHYDIIRMYMAWVKPYLRNIRRMQLDTRKMDSVDLVSAFEGSMVEVEFLAMMEVANDVYAILDVHFLYRTRPELKFQQEGYQRGPIHVGKTQLTFRGYAWTKEELAQYKKFRSQEDMDLLKSVDESVRAAYESLGDELEKYLAEAETHRADDMGGDTHGSSTAPSGSPFTALFKGFGDFGKLFSSPHAKSQCPKCSKPIEGTLRCSHCGTSFRKLSRNEALKVEDARGKAQEYLERELYQIIKRFKASHGFIY